MEGALACLRIERPGFEHWPGTLCRVLGQLSRCLSGPFAANGHVVLRLEHTGPSETKRPRPLKPWRLFVSNVLLVLQTRHVTEQFPAKTGEYPSTSEYAFRIFKSRAREKYLKPPFDFKICSILVLGHYLSLEAHSFPWAELFAFWQQMGDFVYIISFLLMFSEVCFWSRSSQGSSLRHCGVFHWSLGRASDTIRWKGWYGKCFIVCLNDSRVTDLY